MASLRPLIDWPRRRRAGQLELLLGPMASGKTSTLISKLTRLADLGYSVGYVNTSRDTRETDGGAPAKFTTHNSTLQHISARIPCFRVTRLAELEDAGEVEALEVIGVDEAHFFDDLCEVVLDWVRRARKHLIVCGLDGSYLQEPIGRILELIPKAENVVKVSSQCLDCVAENPSSTADYPAGFTIRLSNETGSRVVAGLDKYRPACRYHYDLFMAGRAAANGHGEAAGQSH